MVHGLALWKPNVSVLSETEYASQVSSFWASWQLRKASFTSLAEWWEVQDEGAIHQVLYKKGCLSSLLLGPSG